MAADDRSQRRERFMRELATRDLYEWFGIPHDAGDDAIREAAERKRRELSTTPMPQKKRSMERAFCDQGEKALLRPDVRREYDSLLQGGSPSGPARAQRGPQRGRARGAAEGGARAHPALRRRRCPHGAGGGDPARVATSPHRAPGRAVGRGGIDSAEQALRTARQARARPGATRGPWRTPSAPTQLTVAAAPSPCWRARAATWATCRAARRRAREPAACCPRARERPGLDRPQRHAARPRATWRAPARRRCA